jgi:hypothetical protein
MTSVIDAKDPYAGRGEIRGPPGLNPSGLFGGIVPGCDFEDPASGPTPVLGAREVLPDGESSLAQLVLEWLTLGWAEPKTTR